MEEFKKIELNTPAPSKVQKPGLDAVRTSAEPMSRKKRKINISRKKLTYIGVFLGVFVLFLVFFVILPLQRTIVSGQKTYKQARAAWEAIKLQDIEKADIELKKTQESLKETQSSLGGLAYTRFIPIIGGYYNDADHALKAGVYGIDASLALVDSLKPYADVLGLKGGESFVMGSAEDRIKTVVLSMGKITPRIDEIADDLVKAQKEIDQIDPNHYPEFIAGGKLHNTIKQAQAYADEGVVFVEEARPLIKVLPSLLGEKERKRYLVLFQNDKELRATGGFITAYAIFNVDKGNITVERSDDIYSLDNGISGKPKAPDAILKYLPKVTQLNLRDSNISPDFEKSMETFLSLYEKAPNKMDVDGIIALDTSVLVSTIKILDNSVTAGGITFTSDIDERCDCPQAIYELEDNISRPVGYVREARKALLGELLIAIMQKAMKSSPKLYWGPLFQNFLKESSEKHILFYLFDKNAQKGIEALNFAGQIKPFEGDYLAINQTNFSGAKTNIFVKEAVTQDYKVENDGTITKTVTINFKNDHAPSDCNLERGGLCLNALHRDWFRIYVPKGSELVSSKGSEVKVTSYEDLGKTVFDGFTTVRPKGQNTLTLTYKLPFKVEKGSPLPLLIQKQPGTPGFPYVINVNGKEVSKFDLTTDKEVKLNL